MRSNSLVAFLLASTSLTMGAALPALEPDSFTLIGIPDPQYLAVDASGAVFYRGIVDWTRTNCAALRCQAVIVYGDLVDTSWTPAAGDFVNSQEQRAQDALSRFDLNDTTAAPIPWLPLTGNHDIINGSATLAGWPIGEAWKDSGGYWSAAAFLAKGQSWWNSAQQFWTSMTGAPNANSYFRLTIGTRTLLLIRLEPFPSPDAAYWALRLMAQYPADEAIVATHIELNTGALTTNEKTHYGLTAANACDGADLWTILRRSHNLVLVLSGHEEFSLWSTLDTTADDGHVVHHVQADYQTIDAGAGWTWGTTEKAYVQLLVFRPSLGVIDGYILSSSTGNYVSGHSATTPLFSVSYPTIPAVPGTRLQGGWIRGAHLR
jgi:hypothetical protein